MDYIAVFNRLEFNVILGEWKGKECIFCSLATKMKRNRLEQK